MLYLLIVSLVWAFSFGIIKDNLAGVDPNFVAFARLFLSLLIFLPVLRLKGMDKKLAVRLALIGMVQYGIMYVTYNYSFRFLKAYEVALFTIFTPLYVALINNFIHHHFYKLPLVTALMAIVGAAIVEQAGMLQSSVLLGFLVVQISNVCFAFGQIYYKEITARLPGVKDYQIFGWLYLGAALITALSTTVFTNWQAVVLGRPQILSLLYLGVVASGICFFFWNFGARKVNVGALAIFNNLKIPLAITVSLVFFHEKANLLTLIAGGVIMVAALVINEAGVAHERLPSESAA